MSDSPDDLGERPYTTRTRIVAWVVIIALVLVGGGATVVSLLIH
ncbi:MULTISPECIES: hypothetical protein [Microbacterium]|jgi:hypothetical protein|uniref:Uncharacterized protein n=1 Tax=Microbacterium ginsengisoli TaxID=400772 RepID=A0A0F0LTF6_9MICO|nr:MULTISPECIES: hypothetical protein [Microbacterium]KJL36009.1 hypothetical protein RR49_02056 [Microbacterium ginsengisoli]